MHANMPHLMNMFYARMSAYKVTMWGNFADPSYQSLIRPVDPIFRE
jgi:hypothetical protein